MGTFRVIIKGEKQFITAHIKLLRETGFQDIAAIANSTSNVMRDFIKSSSTRKGYTGNLEKSIFAQPIQKDKLIFGWGVGNIEYLNRNAPYWRWINFGIAGTGRRIPPGTDENPRIKGHFEPNDNGRFVKTQPKFIMNPKRPIFPHLYIQRTLQQVPNIINGVLSGRTF